MIDLKLAFTIGLVGSLHCLGMCGPIVVALPLGNRGFFDRFSGGILYNLGRTITYGLLGAVFGLLGKGISMAGFQQWASILMGVVMIASVLFPFLFRSQPGGASPVNTITQKIVQRLRSLFANHRKQNLLMIGLLNGLLPCGLVYVAVAGAIQSGSILHGVLFMAIFGLGTIPLLLVISLSGQLVGSAIRRRLSKVIPVFIVLLGIVFILRGMSLGIPYISPQTQMLTPDKEVNLNKPCCVKSEIESVDKQNPDHSGKK